MATEQKWGRKESIIWPPRGFYYTWGAVFLALVFTGLLIYVRFSFGLGPLERYYLPYYLRSEMTIRPSAKFQLLYVGDGRRWRLALPDDVKLGETPQISGKPLPLAISDKAQKEGERLLVREAERVYAAKSVHRFLTQYVYVGAGVWPLFSMQIYFGVLALLLGLPFALPRDIQRRKELRYGRRLKGPYLVSAKQFNAAVQGDGIGIQTEDIADLLRIPARAENQHILAIGDTGSGKTSVIRQLAFRVQERRECAVLYDPAGEFIRQFYNEARGDIVLNPQDARMPYWNPADEVEDEPEALTLAESFYQPDKTQNEFFIDSPQKIFAYLISRRPKPRPEDLVQWMATKHAIETKLRDTEYAVLVDQTAGPQRAGVLSSLNKISNTLRMLPTVADHPVTEWTARAWAENRKGWIFLTSNTTTRKAIQQRHEKLAENRKAAEEQIRKLRADKTRKQARVQKAQDAWTEWLGQWSLALKSLAFADDTESETVADHLDVIDEMRGLSHDIDQLKRERIAKIERDIEGFSASVAALVTAVASDLARHEPEDAVLQLEKHLEDAKRTKDQQAQKDQAISALEKRIEECRQARTSAQRVIDKLQEQASVDNPDQLREVMHVSRRQHELGAEKASLEETLDTEGDGLPLTELRTECQEVDLDQIAAREESLQNELKDLRDHLTPAAEQRVGARRAFEAIGGEGRAAQAAAARQEALASMRDAAEQYIHVRTAATLLQWAIDRYRREKQAPLLKCAGGMFGTLTLGSFNDLRVEYDDQDHARLAGIRPDKSSVSISGMSDGTADQLYLALRLASVDKYLGRSHALPFVADDLLINFDDARAAAGFRVLAELGQKTQILFFTHHQHLVDIAQATLGTGINVISLAEETFVSAT